MMCFQMADAERGDSVTWDEITNAFVFMVRQQEGRDRQQLTYYYEDRQKALEPPPSLDAAATTYCEGLGLFVPFRPPRSGAAIVKVVSGPRVVVWEPEAVVMADSFANVLAVAFMKRLGILVVTTSAMKVLLFGYDTIASTLLVDADERSLGEYNTARRVRTGADLAKHRPEEAKKGMKSAKQILSLKFTVIVPETHVAVAANIAGTCLVTGSRLGVVYLWESSALRTAVITPRSETLDKAGPNGTPIASVVATHIDTVCSLRFTTETVCLAASCDGCVSIIDCATLSVTVVGTADHTVTCVTWCAAAQVVVAGGVGGCLSLWSNHLGSRATELADHVSPHRHTVSDVRSPGDAPVVISADEAATFKIWDMRSGACLQTLHAAKKYGPHSPLNSIYFMPDRSTLLGVGGANELFLMQAFHHTARDVAHEYDPIRGVLYMSEVGLIVSFTASLIRVWHAYNGSIVVSLQGSPLLSRKNDVRAEVTCLCSSGSKELWFILGTSFGEVKMVHLIQGSVLKGTTVQDAPCFVSYSVQREWVIVGTAAGVCTVMQNVKGEAGFAFISNFCCAGLGRFGTWCHGNGDIIVLHNAELLFAVDPIRTDSMLKIRAAAQCVTLLGSSNIAAVVDTSNVLTFYNLTKNIDHHSILSIMLCYEHKALRSSEQRVTCMAFEGLHSDTLYLATAMGDVVSFLCKRFLRSLATHAIAPVLGAGTSVADSLNDPISAIAVADEVVITVSGKRIAIWTESLYPIARLSSCTTQGYRFPVQLRPLSGLPPDTLPEDCTYVEMPYLLGFEPIKGYICVTKGDEEGVKGVEEVLANRPSVKRGCSPPDILGFSFGDLPEIIIEGVDATATPQSAVNSVNPKISSPLRSHSASPFDSDPESNEDSCDLSLTAAHLRARCSELVDLALTPPAKCRLRIKLSRETLPQSAILLRDPIGRGEVGQEEEDEEEEKDRGEAEETAVPTPVVEVTMPERKAVEMAVYQTSSRFWMDARGGRWYKKGASTARRAPVKHTPVPPPCFRVGGDTVRRRASQGTACDGLVSIPKAARSAPKRIWEASLCRGV